MLTELYAIPAWLMLILTVAIFVGAACGGRVLVRRAFPRVDFAEYNIASGIVLGVVGALFAVTVAFIIAIVWQEFDGTSQRAAMEVGAATDLWHTSRGLPPPLGTEMRRNVADYARLMIDDEWSKMRSGGSSERAEATLTRTFEDLSRFRPVSLGESNAQAAALRFVGELHDMRHRRLDDNASGVSGFEWGILLIGASVTLILCYFMGAPDFRAQLTLIGAVAAMIAAMFVLIFELDYPFRGDLTIAPAGWADFLSRNHPDV